MPHKPREMSRRLVDWSKFMGKVPHEVRGKSRKKLAEGCCNTGSFHCYEEARALRILQSRFGSSVTL